MQMGTSSKNSAVLIANLGLSFSRSMGHSKTSSIPPAHPNIHIRHCNQVDMGQIRAPSWFTSRRGDCETVDLTAARGSDHHPLVLPAMRPLGAGKGIVSNAMG